MISTFRTGILLLVLTLFFIWIGDLIAGQTGMIFAFLLALVMNFLSYWYSDKIVLGIYRAQPLPETEAPMVYKAIREIIEEAKVPMPKVYIMHADAPNAFATGRNPKNACVCVTSGLLRILNYDELKGVLAHEIAHIRNRDTLIQTVAATIAGAIMVLANMARWAAIFGGYDRDRRDMANSFVLILVAILAPIAALIIQMAISRQREFGADESGAKFARSPHGLADALLKLDQYARHGRMQAHPTTAHIFIVNPLRGSGIANLFSTHPPIHVRVERLRRLSI